MHMEKGNAEAPGWRVEQLDFDAAGRVLEGLIEDPESARANPLPSIAGYQAVEEIGRGAGGIVYIAMHPAHNRPVAIKVFHRRIGEGDATQRAWRELDLLAQLQLPCVPRVLDYGLHEDQMFLVTEYIEGKSLSAYCAAGYMTIGQRVSLLSSIAEAVQEIHDHGVLHRDLKPTNVIITPRGEPVIIDFGIASLLDPDANQTLTIEGAPIGTPAFMAPEQARGERSAVSVRCDVYSLGAIAYWMLLRQTPIDVECPVGEALRRITTESPRDPRKLDPSLDRELSAVLLRAVANEPADRTPSVRDLQEDLTAWLRGDPISWTKPSTTRVVTHWVRRHRAASLTALLIFSLFVTALGAGFYAVSQARYADGRLAESIALKERWDNAARLLEGQKQLMLRVAGQADDAMRRRQYEEAVASIRTFDELMPISTGARMGYHHDMMEKRPRILMDVLHAAYTDDYGTHEPEFESIRKLLELIELQRFEAYEAEDEAGYPAFEDPSD
jgi:predicted Ser/Thr protein kinase